MNSAEFSNPFSDDRNNAIDKHYLIVIKDLIPLIEWTCYFKKLFEGIDFKNFVCRVKNFLNYWHKARNSTELTKIIQRYNKQLSTEQKWQAKSWVWTSSKR